MGTFFNYICGKNDPNSYDIIPNNPKNKNYVNLEMKVKSKYILKKILLILDKEKRLYLARYNKFYTRLLGITIEHYKNFSGRIKIGGKNGYGKEYGLVTMNLIFKDFI